MMRVNPRLLTSINGYLKYFSEEAIDEQQLSWLLGALSPKDNETLDQFVDKLNTAPWLYDFREVKK